ncbi:N-acetyl-gamma-glutamyl-phosphate reductase [Alteromonadaceae bacterium M269]|nr:N-acetyl-gamma-glutamyl-phosphate reductase [Alteromonadaceae bacterium M269]
MISCCVIGASGYTGAELAFLLSSHSEFSVDALFVSENSQDKGKVLSELHGRMAGVGQLDELVLKPLTVTELEAAGHQYDAIFLATPHEASHDWMPQLTAGKAVVLDLSGAFRIKDKSVFSKFYGFEHQHGELLENAVYGLADWFAEDIATADIIAVPGCYPTASLSALKPLEMHALLDENQWPVINATSGVSGAGRKSALTNSYCEVSLQAYGVLGHRHQPEISDYLTRPVIFTPHLGNFKRGILATVTAKLKEGVDEQQVNHAYVSAYQGNPIIRLKQSWPKLDDVVGTPYCDICWKVDEQSGHLVVTSAIDNLLKGAASQAVQCANLRFGFESHQGLVG